MSIKSIVKKIPGVLDYYHAKNQKNYRDKYFSLPIDENKIVFNNYMGRGYGCNCKYVAEKLLNSDKKYDLVWLCANDDFKNTLPVGIRAVDFASEEAFKELATAKFWVCNYHLIDFFSRGVRKKEGQIYIQLWHGSFGIKKSEGHVAEFVKDKEWVKEAVANSEATDYWISNSKFENDVYIESFWNVKKESIKEYGHPRNDIFFKDASNAKKLIRDYIGIDECVNIALYVPTFRPDFRLDCYNIDYDMAVKALEKKFGGKWVFAVRLHPKVSELAGEAVNASDSVYNVTDYPDIQELLAGSDACFTDYSSAVFDFMLSENPAFIYATDVEKYDMERGFYFKLEESPFPVAHNNDELIDNILNFNGKDYKEKVKEFLSGKGSFEDGNAAERVFNLIESL